MISLFPHQSSLNNSDQSASGKSQLTESDTSADVSSSAKGKKKKKKTVGFAVEEAGISPTVALTWLIDMIVQADCQPILLSKNKEDLKSILEAMQVGRSVHICIHYF